MLVAFAALLYLLRPLYSSFGVIDQGIYIESWGTVLDILVVGVLLTLFNIIQDRRARIDRHLEEIGDFKKWDGEEGRLRIAGNIRRLAKLGKTDIDFSGLVLRDFSFDGHDIVSLKGSTFSHGLHTTSSKNSTTLENVSFSFVDCTGVTFSRNTGPFPGLALVGKNLTFHNAKLADACFDGARLAWTNSVPNEDDWHEDHGADEEDGRPVVIQIHHPAFDGADLRGCSFRYAELDHADFRYAENILEADFTGAEKLETCFFDDDVREQVLTSKPGKSNAD